MQFTLACDLMMDLEGSIRPAMCLANALIDRGHNVSMMSPVMSHSVEESLSARGIVPVNLRVKLAAKNSGLSLLWFETWAREAFLNLNSKHMNAQSTVDVNFSHTVVVPSRFWYLQGPTSNALVDMRKELNATYRLVYEVFRPMIEFADGKLVKDMSRNSTFCVANSKFCASMYRKWGIRVNEIIYPPIDCRIFRPKTLNPSSDYVLAYFGKETKFSIVKAVADLGVRFKAFGSKAPLIPRSLTGHPNVDFLGRISADQLVNVYTNALFTFFPFTHEPFGYIPVESMACGTPTLAYNSQGPSESIVDGYSGWSVKGDAEIISKAVSIWKQGYKREMRQNCVKEASKYDESIYINKWLQILEESPARDLQTTATPLISIGSLPVKTSL
jgi:glycosyltransferase involved in cell wall biosynthesis